MTPAIGQEFRPALEALMSRLPAAIYATDERGRLVYMSGQVERLLGTTAATVMRDRPLWSSFVHQDDAAGVHEQLLTGGARAAGSVPALEYRLTHRDGTTVWVRDYAIELLERGRRIRQGALLDITAERVAEAAREATEAHYTSLLDTADDVIVRLDRDESITFASGSATRSVGREPADLVGSKLSVLVHPVDRARFGTAFQQALAEAEPQLTFRLAGNDGKWMWVRATARGTWDSTGRIDGVQMVLHDVSDSERTTAELTAAERMLSAALDAVDEGFVLQTSTGEMLALNKRARELLGPLGAVRDRLPPGWTLLDDGGLPISAAAGPTKVVLDTDQPISGTIQVRRNDGTRAWLAVDCRPLHRAGEDRPFAALASFADVTPSAESGSESQALQAEQALRRHAEDVAQRLRSIFAPPSPPSTPGVTLAGRYVPADEGVSGDWHEAIPLPDGTLGLAIGDVTGHGIDAAAMMGTLRSALHAYALEMHEPHVVLEKLNLILLQAGARMASVLYAILDPEEGVVRFASAGHPPMMLVEPTGAVSYLRSGRSPLLGHPHTSERPQAVASLEAGSTLLLYTDGVLEGGCKSVDEALDRLARRGGEAATLTLEEMCAHVLPELPPGEQQLDDAAMLACRLVPMDEPSLQVQLDADPSQLRVLRRTLGRWLDTFEPGRDERFQLLLATDEAARNAVEHAYGLEAGSFAVDATRDGDLITIRVTDAGRWRSPGGRRKGRGIALMRKLVDEMEIRDLNPGTEVVLMRRLRHE